MAERLGDAVLELRTDDRSYEAGIKRAETGAQRLDRRFRALSRSAGRVGRRLAIGLGAASTALFLLSRRAIAAADDIAKTADRIGLSVEGLQELRFAAKRTGVELAVFQQGLTAMVRRAGEAQRGNESFAKAFRAVGLSAEELKRLEPEEILRRVADGLARIPNEAEKIAIADQIFSEAGRRMINVLRLQSKGLDDMAAKAHRLGIILSEDTIRRAEQANDELSDMGDVLRVAGLSLGLEFMPVMRELAQVLTNPAIIQGARELGMGLRDLVRWATENSETLLRVLGGLLGLQLGSRFGPRGALVGVLLGAGFTPEILKLLRAEVEGLDEAIESLQETTTSRGAAGAGGPAGEGFEKMREQIADLRFEAGLLSLGLSDSVEEAARAARASGLVETFDDMVASSDEVTDAMLEFVTQWERLRDFHDVEDIIARTATAQERLNDELERLEELKPRLTAEQYARALANIQERVAALDEDQSQLNDAARDLGFTFTSAFEDAVIGGEDLRSVFGGLIADIQRMILRLLVLEPLARAISDAFKGGSSGGGGGFLGSLLTAGLSLFSGGGPSVAGGTGAIAVSGAGVGGGLFGARGHGGPAFAHRPVLVGEFGPEVFDPPSSGTIIPNDRIGGDTFIIDARGADPQGLAELKAMIMGLAGPGRVEERAVGAVVGARRRDPRLFSL